jgi:Fur family transcriptional regulator, zinc uptake regulator
MSACTHEPHVHGATDVSLALETAEARCTSLGHRWTEPRRRVLELLVQAGAPVKAYDLMAAYGEAHAKPATVYRALEFLERVGFVHRIVSLSAFQACIGHEAGHAASFLICDCCGEASEFEADVGERIEAAIAGRGFAPEAVVIEVHGRCERCRS